METTSNLLTTELRTYISKYMSKRLEDECRKLQTNSGVIVEVALGMYFSVIDGEQTDVRDRNQ